MFGNTQKTLCYVAGGSGGHMLPALMLAKKECKDFPDTKILFFTTYKKIDTQISLHYPWISQWIMCSIDAPGRSFRKVMSFCFKMCFVVITSLYYLIKNRPARVIATGGFLSLPVCYAAKVLDIPIDIYELNSTPRRAVNVVSRWAENVYITFQSCGKFFPNRSRLVSYPLRFEEKDKVINKAATILALNNEIENKELLFDVKHKIILIVCGSQGSVYINNLFKEWLKGYNGAPIQVIHQIGFSDQTDWQSFYSSHNVPAIVFSYREDIGKLYGLVDVVICRGGAGTLFEVEFFKRKCIIIPLEGLYTSHQVDNAVCMAQSRNSFIVQRQHSIQKDVCELGINLNKLL